MIPTQYTNTDVRIHHNLTGVINDIFRVFGAEADLDEGKVSVAQEIGSMNDAMMPRTVARFHIYESKC